MEHNLLQTPILNKLHITLIGHRHRHCHPFPVGNNVPLLGHVGERLGKLLLAERKLSDGPDLGILNYETCQKSVVPLGGLGKKRAGVRETYGLEVLLDLGL